jgi:hypothetical protein
VLNTSPAFSFEDAVLETESFVCFFLVFTINRPKTQQAINEKKRKGKDILLNGNVQMNYFGCI